MWRVYETMRVQFASTNSFILSRDEPTNGGGVNFRKFSKFQRNFTVQKNMCWKSARHMARGKFFSPRIHTHRVVKS